MGLLGLVVGGLGMLLLAAGCSKGAPPADHAVEADTNAVVTLLLNWFPEAEHGGYFAALENGFYAAEGLRVRMLPGGPGAAVIPRVATGAADFGVENADNIVLARAQEADVLAVMAPIQIHPRCIMVHAESGIARLADLHDVTLAMNPGSVFAQFLQRHAVLKNVRIVPFGGNVSQFLADPQMAQQAYTFSEPFAARQAGANPRLLLLADIGFNPYTSCLLTSRTTVRDHPELVRRMVRASIRGWERYLEDATAAHARIQAMNPEMGLPLLEFGRQALQSLVRDGIAREHGIGTMTPARWESLCAQLVEIDLIPPGAVAPRSCYTLEFLPAL